MKHSFSVESRPEELEAIFAAVEEISDKEEWPPDMLFRIKLVLEEMGLNIINYGYDEDDRKIDFMVDCDAEAVTIEISDEGKPFDPLSEVEEPDVDAAMGDRPIGGLGVHLVRTMMDEMHYQRVDGKNLLTLVSRRAE